HSRIGVYHTDAEGWATLKFPHPELNYISIWANHAGYAPHLIQWTRRQHGAFPKEYVYRAEPGLRIHGLVQDEHGAPVSGAVVRIKGPNPNFAGDAKEFLMLTHALAVTDANGRWSCSEIPRELSPEAVQIRVLHPDFPLTRTRSLSSNEFAGAEIVTPLPGGVVFRTRVFTPERQPVVGAKVVAGNPQLRDQVRGTTTDATGEFTLRLPSAPGGWEVLVQADGYAPASVTNAFGQLLWPAIPIVLTPGRSITIRVTDDQGAPVAGALVEGVYSGRMAGRMEVIPEFIILEHPVTTDRNGEARWDHAPADRLSFRILKDGFNHGLQVPVGATMVSAPLTKIEELAGLAVDAKTGRPLEYFKLWQG
ncbi:MAG: carboxypeptidase regulatory-like domain-containing protein, partial [Verrucomicrobiae bacterium]|nr:carboxypeptidase regulatory-like domain-containing protein [Verrucomicrobiae bacterium]